MGGQVKVCTMPWMYGGCMRYLGRRIFNFFGRCASNDIAAQSSKKERYLECELQAIVLIDLTQMIFFFFF